MFVEIYTISLLVAKMIFKHFFTGNCKDPGQPQNGGRLGDNFGYGSTVTFWCQSPSYFLVGASRITCKEGSGVIKHRLVKVGRTRHCSVNIDDKESLHTSQK